MGRAPASAPSSRGKLGSAPSNGASSESTLAGARLPASVAVDYVGINHLGFLCRVAVDGVDRLPELVEPALEAGVRSFLLFGLPSTKDERGSSADDPDQPVQRALELILRQQQPYPAVVVVRLARREADAAIAEHSRRDAVDGRRTEAAVPGRLAVIMGVDVDEAGGDDASPGVDFLRPRARNLSHCDDPPLGDGDVALERGRSRAVEDGAVADDEVMRAHGVSLLLS